MAKTETVATQYGETTIEVVDCDSCGTTIAKDDASEFTLGDRDGWACQHCVDDGPLSFPERTWNWIDPAKESAADLGIVGLIIFFPLMVLVGMPAGFRSDSSTYLKGYATASLSYLIWLLFLGVICLFAFARHA